MTVNAPPSIDSVGRKRADFHDAEDSRPVTFQLVKEAGQVLIIGDFPHRLSVAGLDGDLVGSHKEKGCRAAG